MRELLLDAKTFGITVLVIIFDIFWLWTYFRGWKSLWLMFNIFTSHQGGSFFLLNFIFQLNGTWYSVFYLQISPPCIFPHSLLLLPIGLPLPSERNRGGGQGKVDSLTFLFFSSLMWKSQSFGSKLPSVGTYGWHHFHRYLCWNNIVLPIFFILRVLVVSCQ